MDRILFDTPERQFRANTAATFLPIRAALLVVILSASMCAAQNPTLGKADPAMYPRMRASALAIRNPNIPTGAVAIVLMDWHVANGLTSVLAASDGTASIYLSSGGGFIGGGQRYPQLRLTAQYAVQLAANSLSHFGPTESTLLPPDGEVYFYVTTANGLLRASSKEADFRNGTDPLLPLGNAMQQIVTLYRQTSSPNPEPK